MSRRSLRLSAIAAAVIAAAAVIVVSGTLVDGNRQARRGDSTPARTSIVPGSGTYLGAYVKPAAHTPQAQIEAVRSFERRLGHPVGLVHVYHPWRTQFPSAADR